MRDKTEEKGYLGTKGYDVKTVEKFNLSFLSECHKVVALLLQEIWTPKPDKHGGNDNRKRER